MENKLTPEQIEKVKACKSAEELTAFVKECGGFSLTDEELMNVTGGASEYDLLVSMLAPYFPNGLEFTNCDTFNYISKFAPEMTSDFNLAALYLGCRDCDRASICLHGRQWQNKYFNVAKAIKAGKYREGVEAGIFHHA